MSNKKKKEKTYGDKGIQQKKPVRTAITNSAAEPSTEGFRRPSKPTSQSFSRGAESSQTDKNGDVSEGRLRRSRKSDCGKLCSTKGKKEKGIGNTCQSPKSTISERKTGKEDDNVERAKSAVDKVIDIAKIIRHQNTVRRKKLETTEQIRRLVAEIINNLRMGLIVTSHAETIFKGCRLLFDIIDSDNTKKLEKRIQELERLKRKIK